MNRRASALALAIALSAAIALGGVLSGCGQKGPLYLPQQKKSRVPATPANPAPEATDVPDASGDQPGNSPAEKSPGDNSAPTSDSTPRA